VRIGIDVRYLSHGLVGGVHTYVAHFVPAVLDLARDHQIYLYADTKRPLDLHDLPGNVTLRLLPWHSPLSSIGHDLLMRRQMAHDRLDVVHYPANYGFGPPGTRLVITLHDAINLMPLREIVRGHPKNLRTVAMMSYLHLLTRRAVRHADILLTVSTHAAREIIRHSGFDPRRIFAVPHAPMPDLRPIDDPQVLAAVRARYALARPFVLADAIKNPAALVRAWQQLPAALRASHEIVFFARRPDPPAIVCAAVTAGYARLLVRPPREDLIALYSMAEAFVFPSWIEGFGIPVLEAMACGAPVIASDRGAIPEVTGDAALLADAGDDATLALHIARVLSDPAEARRLRERGFARASSITWHDVARQILRSYELASQLP
jgi:glycosyltransferase involved in cell wall biosynthesis